MRKKNNKVPAWRKKLKAEKEKKKNKILEIRVAIVVVFFLLISIFWSSTESYRVAFLYDSIKFKSVNAEIIKSDVVRRSYTSNKTSGTSYSVKIKYRFEIDSKVFDSDVFSIEDSTPSFDSAVEANKFISNYPIGLYLKIFYEEGNPSLSFIKLEGQYTVFVFYIVFFLITFIFILCVLYFYKKLDINERKQVFRKNKIE